MPSTARVVVLAGPSGAGKSRLAARLRAAHGWPIVHLDDFYRDGDDPCLPRSADLGIIDWDHPGSWNREAALSALEKLVREGATQTPTYDIAHNRAVGLTTVRADPADLVVAEGIFSAEIIQALREQGMLHSAWCVYHPRLLTFVWRLLRDLKERRKPPMLLLRRGVALLRAEPDIVRRQESLGARPAPPAEVERQLSLTLSLPSGAA